MIDEKKTKKGKDYRAKRLQAIQGFAELNFNFPCLSESLNYGHKGIAFIRAGYVSYPLYLKLLLAINELQGLDANSIQSIKMIAIIAYRTGLRLQELIKLRLCDVESLAHYWLHIKSNPFGDNKTQAGLRKIPLSALLNEHELILWKQYFSHRLTVKTSNNELLFCQDDNGTYPWEARVISKLIADLLRQISRIPIMVFHHLRHTAFSNLHLMAEKVWDVAELLTGLSHEQVVRIYNVLFGEKEELRIYWGLASFCGHNSPSTTIESYLHFSDLIIYRKLSENKVSFSYSAAKSVTALSGRKITELVGYQNKDNIRIEMLRSIMTEQLAAHIDILGERQDTPNIETIFFGEKLTKKETITTQLAYTILSDVEQGYDINLLTYKYPVEQEDIEKWLEKAYSVAGIKTRKGQPRLISTQRFRTNENAFLPARSKSAIERQEVAQITERLRNDYLSNKNEITWAVCFYINNITSSSAGILFPNEKYLTRFKQALSGAIDEHQWHQRNLNSSIYLYLKHPKEKRFLQKDDKREKYSSTSLRYILHMLAILLP